MGERPKRREFDFLGVTVCGIALMYVGFVAPAFLAAIPRASSPGERARAIAANRCEGQDWYAIQAAEGAVRVRVSNADLPWPPDAQVRTAAGCTYEVESYFDAGGIRRRYVAIVRPIREYLWEAVGVELQE